MPEIGKYKLLNPDVPSVTHPDLDILVSLVSGIEKPPSYWKLYPQLKVRVMKLAKDAQLPHRKAQERIRRVLGDFPRTTVQLADKIGVFDRIPPRSIDIMLDYFSDTSFSELGDRYNVSSARIYEIVSFVRRRFNQVRGIAPAYYDQEIYSIYKEELSVREKEDKTT